MMPSVPAGGRHPAVRGGCPEAGDLGTPVDARARLEVSMMAVEGRITPVQTAGILGLMGGAVTNTRTDRLPWRRGRRAGRMMTPEDRRAIDRMLGVAARHRRMAALHDALGEPQQATDCRVLAALEEDRARRLERRGNAA